MEKKANKTTEKTTEKTKKAKVGAKKTSVKAETRSAKKTNQKETNLIRRVTLRPVNKGIENFSPGDTVNVFVKVKEGEKERVQLYRGMVTKIQGAGVSRSFTVRKVSAGIGVERTFPFCSPSVDKVEVASFGKVRRAKLYYLRDLKGKAAKITSELAEARTTDMDSEAKPAAE